MSDDNATLVITDIKAALAAADDEAAEKPACFLVVGGELNGAIFDLSEKETVVGRNPDCAIPLEFNGISRKHFKASMNNGTCLVEDLGSSNGT
ncbi:MAG: FHA domain-containing protein, partial [Bacteriovoracaceae bacterium]